MNLPFPEQKISLEFIKDLRLYDTEKPYYMVLGDGDGEGQEGHTTSETNIELERFHDITIRDVRGRESEFTIEGNGFKFLYQESEVAHDGGEEGMAAYIKQVVSLVQTECKADRVICYDYRRRSNDPLQEAGKRDVDRSMYIAPITVVHIDHTLQGGFRRVQRHLTEDEARKYLSGGFRVRIINVWRPLLEKIEDAPLALCDPNSIEAEDLLEVDRVTEHWVGEVYYVKYNPNQRWYWLRHMRADEVCIFTSFDSHPSPSAMNFCPHATFTDELARPNAPPRESVEVRIIAISKI